MKKLLLSIAAIAFASFTFAQTVITDDNFDSYTAGQSVSSQTTNFETWSGGASEEAMVSTDFANSLANSMNVVDGNDMLYFCNDKTSGIYRAEFKVLVRTGKAGYFNIEHSFGSNWAYDFYLTDNGNIDMEAQGSAVATIGTYTHQTWIAFVFDIDLDADQMIVSVDGTPVSTTVFSTSASGSADITLDCFNFYGLSGNASVTNSDIFIDDFKFSNITPPTVITDDNFDPYTAGQSVSSQTTNFETWSGGASEEAMVSTDFANTPLNSMNIVDGNDMLYYCNDKTTGVFRTEFKVLVRTGKAGYFNIEHSFGSNWAYDFYLTDNGNIDMEAQGSAVATIGTYTHQTWIAFVFDIDLDADQMIVSVDGTPVSTTVFSTSASASADITLDCFNFYGLSGNASVTNSDYFIDDFKFLEITPPSPPVVTISTSPIATDGTANETVAVSNSGSVDMNYRAYTVYDNHATFSGTATANMLTHVTTSPPGGVSSTGNPVGTQMKSVTRFYNSHLKSLIGLTIDSVMTKSFVAYQGDSVNLFILDRGEFINNPALGGQIYSEEFYNIPEQSDYYMALTNPFQITGEEISVGIEVGVGMADTSIFSVEYPTLGVPFCNFRNLGANYTDYPYNNAIYAFVSGTPWPQWLDLTPANGVLAAGASQDLTLTFDTVGLTYGETYTSKVVFGCDDPTQEFSEILVTLTLIIGVNETEKIGVLTYPNPTTDYFNITSDASISNIQVFSVNGQLITNENIDSKTATIDLSNASKGIYYAKIMIGNEIVTKTIIKK